MAHFQQLKEACASNPVFVDLRSAEKFAESPLEGQQNVINVPWGPAFKERQGLPEDKAAILVCFGGKHGRKAAGLLKSKDGYENATWAKSKKQIEAACRGEDEDPAADEPEPEDDGEEPQDGEGQA